MKKHLTVLGLIALAGAAQAGTPATIGMTYDPVSNYYQQYYAAQSGSAAAQGTPETGEVATGWQWPEGL